MSITKLGVIISIFIYQFVQFDNFYYLKKNITYDSNFAEICLEQTLCID